MFVIPSAYSLYEEAQVAGDRTFHKSLVMERGASLRRLEKSSELSSCIVRYPDLVGRMGKNPFVVGSLVGRRICVGEVIVMLKKKAVSSA